MSALQDTIGLADASAEQARGWLARMLLIRKFEERAEQLTLRGKVPGGVHPAVGQEGTAVGVASVLSAADTVSASHRGHHHALAKGMSPDGLMAELYGKATGVSGGTGGSMHLVDFSIGFIGSNGIVGAAVGVALGDAFAAHYRSEQRCAVAFFGDGGVNTGRTWEAVNLAAAWKLPLVVVCENNLYAVETPTEQVTGGGSIVRRAEGFGAHSVSVDGQDMIAVRIEALAAKERALSGAGPTFIEARTYRFSGHGSGEGPAPYRTAEEVARWRASADPIQRLRSTLIDAGLLTDAEYEQMEIDAVARVDAAVAYAEESPWPEGLVV
jgi:pyruvate dehydrogenase E1 component alpha subunit